MQLKLLAWSILQLQGRVRYWQMGLICFYDVACPESDLKGQYIPWTFRNRLFPTRWKQYQLFRKNPTVRLFLQLHWFCIGWNCSSCVMASELSGLCKCPVNTGSDHTRSTSTWSTKFNYMMIMILIWQLILIIYLKLYLLIQCSSSIISAIGKRNLTVSKFLFTTF